jgi:hypothetical protein
MKLTKTTLRQLIREELAAISENLGRCSELQEEWEFSEDAKHKALTLASARDAGCPWTEEVDAPHSEVELPPVEEPVF